jgi:hypothetical protein
VNSVAVRLFDPERKVSYRRLLAWATGTVLLVTGYVSEMTWWQVTAIFMGMEVAGKGVAALERRYEYAHREALAMRQPPLPCDEPTQEVPAEAATNDY